MPNEVLATYRVQLNADFDFDSLAEIAPYLASLGITHVYCSPYLQAAEGSEHGYDVVEHPRFNEELGGREGFERMADALEANGLSHIVDIVPNHVSTEGNNRWWSVLKNGRDSRHADWFDIDWDFLDGKVCAPLLGDTLEACLEREEIELDTSGPEPVLRYFDHVLPIAPDTDLDAPLPEVIEAQNYWLVYWKRGNRNLNYRRFFDINTLAAIDVDRDDVFESTHSLVLGLVAEGAVTGLRVDHIDGLKDPESYLERLKERTGVPVWVEKILEPAEELPESWATEGTTGYDFLNLLGGLFVDPAGEEPLTELYASFTGNNLDLPGQAHTSKMLVMRQVMIADIKRLYREAAALLPDLINDEDDEGHLMSAIAETIAAFDVYRTYVRPDGTRTTQDERLILDALEAARRKATLVPARFFEGLADLLLNENSDAARRFVSRFQQTSGPVMAKGVEDTLFYRFFRLVSLNEVGGDPGYFGVSPDEFHREAMDAAGRWPRSMLSTSTHDTKRSEDVRARINVLSEIPELWADAVARWHDMTASYRDDLVDTNTEYLIYQTLVGAHPLDADRLWQYLEKATREAKVHTSWLEPDADYEAAVDRYARGLFDDTAFMDDLDRFVEPLITPGRINSLAQTLIRVTYPGVPDTYQGSEVWDLSLVDPDNRRPVDYAARMRIKDDLTGRSASDVWAQPDDGAPKMLVISTALNLRRDMPDVFVGGSYEPLEIRGAHADRALGFVRGGRIAVIVPRLMVGLDGGWGDTSVALGDGSWRDLFSGKSFTDEAALGDLFGPFPVSLLVRE